MGWWQEASEASEQVDEEIVGAAVAGVLDLADVLWPMFWPTFWPMVLS